MNDFLFDPAWWMLAVALAAGVAVWWRGNVRQDKTLARVGLVILGLGIVWSIVSFYVDTPKEHATRTTKQIVRAVNQRNWNRLSELIDERTTFPPIYNNRNDI